MSMKRTVRVQGVNENEIEKFSNQDKFWKKPEKTPKGSAEFREN